MPENRARLDPKDRVFVALDTPEVARAAHLSTALRGALGGVKLGKEFFTAQGPEGVRAPIRALQPLPRRQESEGYTWKGI